MARRRDSWLEMFRDLGEAFFDVVRAELAVVQATAKAWGKSWGIAVGIVALLLFALFWTLGLLTTAAVHGLMVWRDLALWQAALAIAGALLLLIAAGALVVYFLARRYESPVAATRRRVDDHLGWWNQRLFLESGAETSDGESSDGESSDAETSDRPLPVGQRPASEGESDEAAHEQGDGAGPGAAPEPPSDR